MRIRPILAAPSTMKHQISNERLHEAFHQGRLGSEDSYHVWTPLWALRSRIWRNKELRKLARNSLGDLVMTAIDDADPAVLRKMADSLEEMLNFEQDPANPLRADVFFAVEELNASYKKFSRKDLLKWLNEEMDAVVTKEELAGTLEELGLADAVK